MVEKDFDASKVSQKTISEFQAADKGYQSANRHFLNGFKQAAAEISEEFGGFDTLMPSDHRKIFGMIQKIAEPQVHLADSTFQRYCKIARFCVIYCVAWEIGERATRDQLKWCKERVRSFKKGTIEEKMERAWKEKMELEAKKQKEEREWLAKNGSKEPETEQEVKGELIQIPRFKDGQDEDAYWLEYLDAQVRHIQKHMPHLEGGSPIQSLVLRFYREALPVVLSKKTKLSKKAKVA
jgi:hypothetical protein